MKRPYAAPELEAFGSIQRVTGVTGSSPRVDYAYNASGDQTSDGDDHGSYDLCKDVNTAEDANCDPNW